MKLSPPNEEILIKVLSLCAFVFITLILVIVAFTPGTTSYESSIYSAYPAYFWIFFIISISLGALILIVTAWGSKRSIGLVLGLLPIVFSNIILMLIPYFRGYLIDGRGDVLNHIGWMTAIQTTGTFSWDVYPADHVLGVAVSLFSNISIINITFLVPVVFSILFIFFTLLLADQLFEKRTVLLTAALASIMIFGWTNVSFTPNAQSLLFLPFVIFLLLKIQRSTAPAAFAILVFSSIFLMVFFHPLTTLFLIGVLLVIQLLSYRRTQITTDKGRFRARSVLTFLLITLVGYFSWEAYLRLVINHADVIGQFFGGGESGSTFVGGTASLLGYAQPTLSYLMQLTLHTYGQSILLSASSLACLAYFRKARKSKPSEVTSSFEFVALGYAVFFILAAIAAVLPVSFGWERIYNMALFFSLMLIPYTIYLAALKYKPSTSSFLSESKKWGPLFLVIVLVVYFSVFNLYFSPLTDTTNQQVPAGEFTGMTTFFDTRNVSIATLDIALSEGGFFSAIYGNNVQKINVTDSLPVDHFGYENNTSLSASYNSSQYLLLNDLGAHYYEYIYPQFVDRWRFTPEDFQKVELDKGVDRVYSNGALTVYLINPG